MAKFFLRKLLQVGSSISFKTNSIIWVITSLGVNLYGLGISLILPPISRKLGKIHELKSTLKAVNSHISRDGCDLLATPPCVVLVNGRTKEGKNVKDWLKRQMHTANWS